MSDRDYAAKLQSFSERLDRGSERLESADLAALWRATVADSDSLTLNMEVRLYALRNPEVRTRFAEHQQAIRRALARFIDDRVVASGLTLTIPAVTLAGLLDAATWGIVESTVIANEDNDLLEAFFALILDASCRRPTAPGEPSQNAASTPTSA